VAGVALHAVKPAAVNCHDCALHIDQVVLAQIASIPFIGNSDTDEGREGTSPGARARGRRGKTLMFSASSPSWAVVI
jgi:hypothetical protein